MLNMQTLNATQEFKSLITLCETIGLEASTIQTMVLMPAGFAMNPLLKELNEQKVNEIINAFLNLSDENQKLARASLRNKVEANFEKPEDFLESLINHSKYQRFDNTPAITDTRDLSISQRVQNNNNRNIAMPEGFVELMELCQNLGLDIFLDAEKIYKDAPIAFNHFKKSYSKNINEFNLFYIDLPEETQNEFVSAIKNAYEKSTLNFLNSWHNLFTFDNMLTIEVFFQYFDRGPKAAINATTTNNIGASNNATPVNTTTTAATVTTTTTTTAVAPRTNVSSLATPEIPAVVHPLIDPVLDTAPVLVFTQQTQTIIGRYNRLFAFNVFPAEVRQAVDAAFPLAVNAPDSTQRQVFGNRINVVLGYETAKKKDSELNIKQYLEQIKSGKQAATQTGTTLEQPVAKRLKTSTDDETNNNNNNNDSNSNKKSVSSKK